MKGSRKPDEVRTKIIVNSLGEPQATQIVIPIEVMHMVEHLVENELARVEAEGKGGQE